MYLVAALNGPLKAWLVLLSLELLEHFCSLMALNEGKSHLNPARSLVLQGLL